MRWPVEFSERFAMLRLILFTILFSSAAAAKTPKVLTDIPPVHSLVAQVMAGIADPDLIVESGATPHGYSLRPSQARSLTRSDLIIWMGEDMAPDLANRIKVLAKSAESLELLELPETKLLPLRDSGHNHEHGHGHSDHDPHAWLNPENAISWLFAIAQTLSRIDPENAARYSENAKQAAKALSELDAAIEKELAPVRNKAYLTYHDAFQYFENRYGLHFLSSIALSDAASPGPAHIAHLREQIADQGVKCLFTEPQLPDGLAQTAVEGHATQIAKIDPLGADIAPGPDLYSTVLRNMAQSVSTCLSD